MGRVYGGGGVRSLIKIITELVKEFKDISLISLNRCSTPISSGSDASTVLGID